MNEGAIKELKQFITTSISQTFSSLTAQLDKRFNMVEKRFNKVDERFDKVDAHSMMVDKQFNKIDTHFMIVDEQLSKIDDRFSRVYDRLDEVETKIGAKIDDLSASVAEALDVSNNSTDAQFKDHERRITNLEQKAA